MIHMFQKHLLKNSDIFENIKVMNSKTLWAVCKENCIEELCQNILFTKYLLQTHLECTACAVPQWNTYKNSSSPVIKRHEWMKNVLNKHKRYTFLVFCYLKALTDIFTLSLCILNRFHYQNIRKNLESYDSHMIMIHFHYL